jgi:GAF domain-containing protein
LSGTPLSVHGKLIGVLDVDSPQTARFSDEDQAGVELLCRTSVQKLENDLAAWRKTKFFNKLGAVQGDRHF